MSRKDELDPDKAEGTAAQIEWIEIAEELRAILKHRMKEMQTLSPAALRDLLFVMRESYWFELNARSFDAGTKREQDSSIYRGGTQ